MWRKRLHRWAHRAIGASVVVAAALQALQQINLVPLFGDEATPKVMTLIGLAIVALTFLPKMFGPDETHCGEEDKAS